MKHSNTGIQQTEPSKQAQQVLLAFQQKSSPYELCKCLLGSPPSLSIAEH